MNTTIATPLFKLPPYMRLKKVYLGLLNKIDPSISIGKAVVIQSTADDIVPEWAKTAAWQFSYRSIIAARGKLEGMIGIVTQYENENRLNKHNTEPWIRVTFAFDVKTKLICHSSSISMPAKCCITVPNQFFDEAIEYASAQKQKELGSASEFLSDIGWNKSGDIF